MTGEGWWTWTREVTNQSNPQRWCVACAGAGSEKRTEVVRKSAEQLVVAPMRRKKPFLRGWSNRKWAGGEGYAGIHGVNASSRRAYATNIPRLLPEKMPNQSAKEVADDVQPCHCSDRV